MTVICDHAWRCQLGTSDQLPVLTYGKYREMGHDSGYTHCEGMTPTYDSGTSGTLELSCKWQDRVGDTDGRKYVKVPG